MADATIISRTSLARALDTGVYIFCLRNIHPIETGSEAKRELVLDFKVDLASGPAGKSGRFSDRRRAALILGISLGLSTDPSSVTMLRRIIVN